VIDFLKAFAIARASSNLADKEDHRRGVLKRRVDAD
jgi:hypothetical protein